MKFILENTDGGYLIQRYDTGMIVIDEAVFRESLILLPDRIITDWSPSAVHELTAQDFTRLADLEPEIVLLGTGERQHFPHPTLSQSLMERRIGLEVMDTAAACRTYNILMAEGRRVAAALFMI
ncbi:MAG: Mth938-like domain-containing protein [Candidatus Thiodiazotropha sp.]